MYKTRLDQLGIDVSVLGFGCMRFPTLENGSIDYPESEKLIDYAYEHGVNYYDTAYGYHNGESQKFLSKALTKYPRGSYFLADKLPLWECKTKEDVSRIFHSQLENCKTDYFDFYLIHAFDGSRLTAFKEFQVYKFLQEMQAADKIKYIGFSFHGDEPTFIELLADYHWDFVQIQTNYLDAQMIGAQKLSDMLEEKGIPAVIMEPVKGGFLANPPGAAKALLDPSRTPAQWALSWCAGQKNHKIVLSGMSDMQQVVDNVALFSSDFSITGKEKMFDDVREAILSVKSIPCTGCRYCIGCSFSVDIPAIFAMWNKFKVFGDKGGLVHNYFNTLPAEHNASNCTQCGACVELCPQHIQIPQELQAIHQEILTMKG